MMDDNTKDVLVLAITTLSTISIAWIKFRGSRNASGGQTQPPAVETPSDPGPTPGV